MAAVVHALLAHVEQRELPAAAELFLERCRGYCRASRMSECGGNTAQARSLGL